MGTTINAQTKYIINESTKKKQKIEGFIIRDGEKYIGFELTFDEAKRVAENHAEKGSALPGMKFVIEAHTLFKRDEKTGEATRISGYILRGNDGKFAKFSESIVELEKFKNSILNPSQTTQPTEATEATEAIQTKGKVKAK